MDTDGPRATDRQAPGQKTGHTLMTFLVSTDILCDISTNICIEIYTKISTDILILHSTNISTDISNDPFTFNITNISTDISINHFTDISTVEITDISINISSDISTDVSTGSCTPANSGHWPVAGPGPCGWVGERTVGTWSKESGEIRAW